MSLSGTSGDALPVASTVPQHPAIDAEEIPFTVQRLWNWLPPSDRKTIIVGGSALGIGVVVGGTSMYLYRRWTARVQEEQVEVLSRSLGDVYNELRSLQQGMVSMQESLILIKKEPEDGLRRRRPRRMQFYDSDSDDASAYLSAAEDPVERRTLKPILKKSLSNGHAVIERPGDLDGTLHTPGANGDDRRYVSEAFSTGLSPPSLVLTPSDDEDVFEDSYEQLDEGSKSIFEKEFQRGDSSLPNGSVESTTPFDVMDMVLDASVTDEQVKQALDLIKSKRDVFPENAEYLWRLAKATFIYGNQCLKRDKPARIAHIKEAKEYADAAKRLYPSHPDVLKWCALSTGGLARYGDTTQKINYGLATRTLLQSAMDLRPNDASLHHILGRWNYEISRLGWIEKSAVRAVFGKKFSDVTVEDAKSSFLMAEKLKPKVFKCNLYFIAKCFADQGDKAEARKWLDEALQVQRLCVEDELCDQDIQELLQKL